MDPALSDTPGEISTISRRFLAFLIDWAILVVPVAIGAHTLPVLGGLLLLFLYYPVLESSEIQGSIGKYLLGIQVTGLTGERISFGTGCLRLVIKMISMAFLFLGHIIALFTERHQAFHDIVAGTVIVYGRREMSIADAWVKQIRRIFGQD